MTTPKLTDAALDILAERERQQSVEGWTPEHDDSHKDGALAKAAEIYAWPTKNALKLAEISDDGVSLKDPWPWWDEPANLRGATWSKAWYKPKDRRHDLVRSAALLIAEIERLDRIS
jgi:hypothetical protein